MFDQIQAFYQPRTIPEAVRLLQKKKDALCVVAGGTDLVLRAPRSVTALVDISHLGLSFIKRDGKALCIGATTTMAALEQSAAIRRVGNGILAEAAACCGGVRIRNMATIGGNLANASPAADTATPLLALDAEVILQGLRSKRRVPIAEFFSGPHSTVADSSLLIEIVIPAAKPRTAWAFQRLARTERDLAIVSVAAGIQLDRRGAPNRPGFGRLGPENRCAWARIALGAVAPQPMRALAAESVLVGQALTAELIEQAAAAAAQAVSPITDIRASAEYRREMSRVLVRRALHECARRLECAL